MQHCFYFVQTVDCEILVVSWHIVIMRSNHGLFYIWSFNLFMLSGMLSVRLYVSVSSIWANTPAIHSTHRPYSASLSPSNSPSACGWLLPFRQDPWFYPVGVRWLSCVMCVWEPSSSSFAAPPASLLRWCYWGVTYSSSPAVKTHWVQIPVCCTPSGNCFLKKGKTWKRGITETDQWMWYNKRKFLSARWRRGKKRKSCKRSDS